MKFSTFYQLDLFICVCGGGGAFACASAQAMRRGVSCVLFLAVGQYIMTNQLGKCVYAVSEVVLYFPLQIKISLHVQPSFLGVINALRSVTQ